MIFSCFADIISVAASSLPKEKTEELKGVKKGNKLEFAFEIPQNESAKGSAYTTDGGLDVSAYGFEAQGAGQNDTEIELITKGLNGAEFDWSALPGSEFKLIAKWNTTDGQSHEKPIGPITKDGVREFNVDWPVDGTLKGNAVLQSEYDQNIGIRVQFTPANSQGYGGKFKFKVTLEELAESRVDVKYVDPYGRELTDKADFPTGTMPKVTAEELQDVSIDLPKTSGQINMRADKDNLDLDDLHSASDGLTYKVDGQGDEGTVTIGGKDYKLDISQPNAKDIATILLAYQKDVVIPPTKDDGSGKPVDVADGYVRLTFNADENKQDGIKGKHTAGAYAGQQLSYIDVRNDVKNPVKYDDANLKAAIGVLSTTGTKNGITYNQDKTQAWEDENKDAIPETGDVTAKTYYARYLKSNKDVIPYVPADPTNPTNPDDTKVPTVDEDNKPIDKTQYDIVAFKVTDADKTKGSLTLGKLDKQQVISVLVKKGSKWEKVTAPTINVADETTTKANGYKPSIPEKTETVVNGKVYEAQFVTNGQEITPGTPLPDGVFEVKVLRDETSIKTDTLYGKSYAVFKDSKLAKDKFPTPVKMDDTYANPKWYSGADQASATTAVANNKPEDVAITGNTTFLAKATLKVSTTKNSEDYDPHYTGKSGKPGETVQIDAPKFTKNGQTGNVPAPNGTTFTNNNSSQSGVTVDPNTGAITVVIPQDAPVGSTITIEVDVTYPDRSNETVEVKVTVSDNTQPKPEEDKSKTPIVDPVDDGDNIVKLDTGYYILEETKAPVGYKKQAAPWKLQVKEENGSLVIVQNGPEQTAASFLTSDNAVAADNQTGAIKYKSIVKNIDPTAKTFVQRIYVDTRGYTGGPVNVQITPTTKREEIDTPGAPPVTTKGGVKTAYRTTYKITNPGEVDVDKVLNEYDLREANVSVLNTARWRPFDWGFDEDQINLTKDGVYFIDIEGYYDDNIKDLGKIDLKVDFLTERYFQHAVIKNGYVEYEKGGSYQEGNINLGATAETTIGKAKTSDTKKYANWLSKKWQWNEQWYESGKIIPVSQDKTIQSITTSINIAPLYTSNKPETVPQEGMSITNEREVYNITFSKHEMDGDDNENRLEGAVFKLQKKEGSFWYDMDESYVSSAFNGYFGFRRLEPGTYRLLEVAPPEGYRALDGTLLEFVIKTIDPKGELIEKDGKYYDKESGIQVDPTTHKVVDSQTGKIIEDANGYVTITNKKNNYLVPNIGTKEGDQAGNLVDYVTSATAKNIGKVRNEEPGKGSVTIKKVDEKGNAIPGKKNESGDLIAGAKFRATRLGAKTGEDGKPVADAVYEGYVDEKGTLKFEGLPLCQSPHRLCP